MRVQLFTLVLTTAVLSPAAAQNGEEAAVRKALEHYLQGHATGDGAHHRMAFFPQANLYFVQNGALTTVTSEEYASRSSGRPAADEPQRTQHHVGRRERSAALRLAAQPVDHAHAAGADVEPRRVFGQQAEMIASHRAHLAAGHAERQPAPALQVA